MRHWLCLLMLSACASAAPVTAAVPEPRFNTAVTQENIATTICTVGYSKSIRPPTYYTGPIKRLLVVALPATVPHTVADYELDHWVAIEDGGNPVARENLVLQLWPEAREKDIVENRVHREICARLITLYRGRQCFITNWRECP